MRSPSYEPLLPILDTGIRLDDSNEKQEQGNNANAPSGFIPSLEGFRGVAILIVVLSHMWQPAGILSWTLGMVGVTTFFVLSGYLITGILLKMQKQTKTFAHLPLFFASRTVRLAPSLLVCIGSTLVLWKVQGRDFADIKEHAITAMLYLENLYCKEPLHKDKVCAKSFDLYYRLTFLFLGLTDIRTHLDTCGRRTILHLLGLCIDPN